MLMKKVHNKSGMSQRFDKGGDGRSETSYLGNGSFLGVTSLPRSTLVPDVLPPQLTSGTLAHPSMCFCYCWWRPGSRSWDGGHFDLFNLGSKGPYLFSRF